jgi:hypothetical protein
MAVITAIYRTGCKKNHSIQAGKGTPIQAIVGSTLIDADFGLTTIYAKMSFMGNPLPA